MKRISEELRLKIFASYFGNSYLYKNEFGTYKDEVNFGHHMNKHITLDNSWLNLTSVSNITDKHAVILGYINKEEFFLHDRAGVRNAELLRKLGYATQQVFIENDEVVIYSVEDLVLSGIYKLK